jgi:hypothetical protein
MTINELLETSVNKLTLRQYMRAHGYSAKMIESVLANYDNQKTQPFNHPRKGLSNQPPKGYGL